MPSQSIPPATPSAFQGSKYSGGLSKPQSHKRTTYTPPPPRSKDFSSYVVPVNTRFDNVQKPHESRSLTLVSLSLKTSLFATQAIRELKL